MLELWGIRSTPSLPSLLGPLWSEVVALDKLLSMGHIKLSDIQPECKQTTYEKLNCLIEFFVMPSNGWSHLTLLT